MVRILAAMLLLLVALSSAKQTCEVCEKFLQKFQEFAGDDVDNVETSEASLKEFCKKANGKEESFCYYIGALETSATRIISLVTKPLSYGKPVEKICKDLGKKDAQICELKYEKIIDVNEVDLKTLRVKELRKILTNWGEQCKGCAEKRDFIDKINSIKHLHIEL